MNTRKQSRSSAISLTLHCRWTNISRNPQYQPLCQLQVLRIIFIWLCVLFCNGKVTRTKSGVASPCQLVLHYQLLSWALLRPIESLKKTGFTASSFLRDFISYQVWDFLTVSQFTRWRQRQQQCMLQLLSLHQRPRYSPCQILHSFVRNASQTFQFWN